MDHRVIDINELPISCGIVGISRMSDEQERNAFALATHFYHPARGNPPAFVMWSNIATEETNGHRFANFMRPFGEVTESLTALNPKTGNYIRIWTFRIDHEAFKKWWIEERIKRAKNV